MKLSRLALLAVLTLIFCGHLNVTRADNFVITNGTFFVQNSPVVDPLNRRATLPGASPLTGPGVYLPVGEAFFYLGQGPRAIPGGSATFSLQYDTGNPNFSFPPTFTVGDVTERSPFASRPGMSISFQIPVFDLPGGTLPPANVRVTAPFTMTGGTSGFGPNFSFSHRFSGEGTVIFELARQGPAPFFEYRLIFAAHTFGQVAPGVTVTAVPEPATMLLLCTGLIGVGSAVRRRHKARRAEEV